MRLRRGSPRSPGPADDRARWVSWRAERLLAAGFASALARQLADDARVDVHELLGLIDRGCPPHLAARIVAPLDSDEARG